MKKFAYILGAFLMLASPAIVNAASAESLLFNRAWRGYGNSFIFVEQGIEFAVFPDGQFDFNLNRYASNFGVNANVGGVNLSFNTGYGYDAYIQYDDFGAVIQIENVPIYYDNFGRIIQAGSVNIWYNNGGFVNRVGGLYVHYNRFNVFTHVTGFINPWNRFYVFRPWHQFYVIPRAQFCILYTRPYRQFYNPIRHNWYRPYRNNVRPSVSYNIGRRNGRVAQNSNITRRSDRYVQSRNGRRDNVARQGRRGNRNLVDNRRNTRVERNSTARNGSRDNGNLADRRSRKTDIKRDDVVTRGAPVTTSRNERIKRDKRSSLNTSRTDKKRRVTQTTRPVQNRNSRVSSNTKRKSTGVAPRTSRSSKQKVSRNTSAKKRAVTQRSSRSTNKKSTSRSSNSRRGRQ